MKSQLYFDLQVESTKQEELLKMLKLKKQIFSVDENTLCGQKKMSFKKLCPVLKDFSKKHPDVIITAIGYERKIAGCDDGNWEMSGYNYLTERNVCQLKFSKGLCSGNLLGDLTTLTQIDDQIDECEIAIATCQEMITYSIMMNDQETLKFMRKLMQEAEISKRDLHERKQLANELSDVSRREEAA
jgi:hypothetical protein